MSQRLRRELRLLRLHAMVSTPVLIIFGVAAFRQPSQKAKFTEIDAERINIVEPDGKYRLVLSNKPRSIGPIYKGKPFGYAGGNRPGIIIFNDEGTENGGFTFGGSRQPDGTYSASTHMSFDQFDQDQIMVLNYNDNNGRRQVGLSFADRTDRPIIEFAAELDSVNKMPDGPAKTAAMQRLRSPIRDGKVQIAQRLFIGRDRSKSAVLQMADPMGRPRLRIMVDSLGAPALEFLDDSGKVTTRLPERR
jgi:hypothetical protein